jgi:hypothetical protein
MTEQELRVIALQAAATAWSGLTSAGGHRSIAVLPTADAFLAWLKRVEDSAE